MKTTDLTLADKCPKCGTLTLELDPEGDVHCWACGSTFGKSKGTDYLLERHQFYEKNKAAILADVNSIGRKATAKKWKLNGASLYHVLKRWERELSASKGETKGVMEETKDAGSKTKSVARKSKRKDHRGSNYKHLPGVQKHQYFEKNKDAIIADLLSLGRAEVMTRWNICRSALTNFEVQWLTKEQRAEITKVGVTKRILALVTHNDGRLPALPEFSDKWTPEMQFKWLEIYDKLLDRIVCVKN